MSFKERLLEFFMPWKSSKWVMWKAQQDLTACVKCKELHGKIFPTEDVGKNGSVAYASILPLHS